MKCEYEDCGNEAVITGFCEWCCLQGDDEQRAAGEWKIAHDKVKAELAASHKAHAETRVKLEEAHGRALGLSAEVIRSVCGLGDEQLSAHEVNLLAEHLRVAAIKASKREPRPKGEDKANDAK